MTKDDILRMAREANLPECHTTHVKALKRFADLVAAHEREKPVQVSPLEFVTAVLEKEHLVGKPLMWAQWPNKISKMLEEKFHE